MYIYICIYIYIHIYIYVYTRGEVEYNYIVSLYKVVCFLKWWPSKRSGLWRG